MTVASFLIRNCVCLLLLVVVTRSASTETANNRIQILPAPGTVTVDGRAGGAEGWDLSGGNQCLVKLALQP